MAIFGVKYPNRKCKPFTERHRMNLSKALRGRFLGRKLSEEWKKKISESRIGDKNWNKGKHFSAEHRRKIGEANSKIPHLKGEKSTHWKGGVSKLSWYKYQKSYRPYMIRKRGAEGTHSFEQWVELKKIFNYMCLCCKKTEPEIELCQDHIIPLSKEGTDYIENIQPLCRSCNSIKHAKIINYIELYDAV